MANMTGMDIQDVQRLAGELKHGACEIQQIMAKLTQRLHTVAWRGPDRERFVGEWDSAHCAALKKVIGELEQASATANRERSVLVSMFSPC